MSISSTLHPTNVEAMRQQFLEEVAEAAPRQPDTTFAGWDADVQAFLATLRPWLNSEDLMLPTRGEFCHTNGSFISFSIYGYAYFRAWLRKRHLDPEDFRPEEPDSALANAGQA